MDVGELGGETHSIHLRRDSSLCCHTQESLFLATALFCVLAKTSIARHWLFRVKPMNYPHLPLLSAWRSHALWRRGLKAWFRADHEDWGSGFLKYPSSTRYFLPWWSLVWETAISHSPWVSQERSLWDGLLLVAYRTDLINKTLSVCRVRGLWEDALDLASWESRF